MSDARRKGSSEEPPLPDVPAKNAQPDLSAALVALDNGHFAETGIAAGCETAVFRCNGHHPVFGDKGVRLHAYDVRLFRGNRKPEGTRAEVSETHTVEKRSRHRTGRNIRRKPAVSHNLTSCAPDVLHTERHEVFDQAEIRGVSGGYGPYSLQAVAGSGIDGGHGRPSRLWREYD